MFSTSWCVCCIFSASWRYSVTRWPRVQKRELVAYHEAGHAVVGALIPDYDQVAKITITPRGGAGGLTFFAPNEDRVDSGLYSRQFLESQVTLNPKPEILHPKT